MTIRTLNPKLMRYLLIISLVFCSVGAFAQNKKVPPFVRPLPVPQQSVNDFSGFLSSSEKQWLEKELDNYNLQTGNAIAFVSLNTLTDPKTKKEYTIEEAANLYFNTLGMGDSIKNNGVLLMITKSPRRARIEVGKGLETVLTNSDCQTILDEKLVPNFKQQLFFTGIKETVEAIEHILDNAPAAAQSVSSAYAPQNDADDQKKEELSATGGFIVLGFVIGFPALLFWWARKQARRHGWFTGGGYNNRYRRGYNNNSFNNTNNNFYNQPSSERSSSSSTSSSSGSYGGGSSSGGGASGSW